MGAEARVIDYSVSGGLATVRLARAHGNAINADLLRGLSDAFAKAGADPEVRGVLFAANGKLFCPGLDLQELVELDRASMERFMVLFRDTLLEMYTLPKPVVAAVSGHAVAGGCVISLIADLRVLKRGAMIGLNEVIVGVPLPLSVAHLLRDTVHRPRLEEVAVLGRNYSGEEAVAAGLVHEVHDDGGFEEHCRAGLEELSSKDARAFSVTKRFLRASTASRIQAENDAHRAEFLECWFSGPTQERIRRIVENLKSRSA
jgi:enoyl-CoA hydratase